jgi:hypothetical protein
MDDSYDLLCRPDATVVRENESLHLELAKKNKINGWLIASISLLAIAGTIAIIYSRKSKSKNIKSTEMYPLPFYLKSNTSK